MSLHHDLICGLLLAALIGSAQAAKTEALSAGANLKDQAQAALVASRIGPRLLLPPRIYAVEGLPLRLFYDHLVLQEQAGTYRLSIEHSEGRGRQGPKAWVWDQPKAGTSRLQVNVSDDKGQLLQQGQCEVITATRRAGAGQSLRTLILGDSLTHASAHPNHLHQLCLGGNNPALYFLGSHQPASALPQVRHEGYGGWRWQDFLERFDPKGEFVAAGPVARRASSPLLFPSADGKRGELDIPRYFNQYAAGQPPNLILFMLGINDCFGAKPEAPDPVINACLDQAERLLDAMAKAAPKASLAIILTPPPNARQSGFTANYKDRYSRWGWRRIQHRLVERMLERLGPRQNQQLLLWPAGLGLDPEEGYPVDNGVHPNTKGYQQLAEGIYAGLKCWVQGQP